jgi:hypothetical protein
MYTYLTKEDNTILLVLWSYIMNFKKNYRSVKLCSFTQSQVRVYCDNTETIVIYFMSIHGSGKRVSSNF